MVKLEKGLESLLITDKVMNEIKDFNVKKAKYFCPEDSGDLKKSIKGEVNGNEIIVGSNSKYAAHVEYGTERMILAHGPHDPLNPVKNWKAKSDRGDQGTPQQMPFLRPAQYITQKNISKFIPKKILMKVNVVLK